MSREAAPRSGSDPSRTPGAKPRADIRKLYGVLERTVENDPGAGIRPQLGIATLKKHVTGRDVGAHGQVNDVAEKAKGPITNLPIP